MGRNETLADAIRGTWWLISREDYTSTGEKRIDPVLGAEPIAILVYADNHFAAQFMKRDRRGDRFIEPAQAGQNNTAAIGGYDAYFGTFRFDENSNRVVHTLIESISPANIGITVSRSLRVEGDRLVITLDTTTQGGEPVVRTFYGIGSGN